ncbi:GNAT family N-acetyltransferase [Acidovorax sp. D4N7]|uniref:L-ornithine N(alpha)-acyltransferase n=2 Tax=Comamonas endophytica TaxID=2949090 RepID=A0ABY6GFI6_9BURK|nr:MULTISPECIES: GNAT family N-acyltransferase [unclassified Acidovorax]MCD2512706.1 GNAT family N-acetyltransferase [Acidovorax sp. D4N7]UYG53267.1 GNAT family N-acetyltransferase [Acidovorax sp. 5MLIR]
MPIGGWIPSIPFHAPGPLPALLQPPAAKPSSTRLLVQWARHQDEVRAAQRLRHQVFVQEMGARLPEPLAGHDIDHFDDYCEHLLVRDPLSQEVIGTYRLLTPAEARRAGGLYSDNEFDLAPLAAWRPRLVELGRSCVHAEWRNGATILALWGALAEFMQRNRLEAMLGCASMPMYHPGLAYGEGAAAIWQQLRTRYLAGAQMQVQPYTALPLPTQERAPGAVQVQAPALIQGYLRMGAKVLGAPAWDPDFQTADLPLMAKIEDLPARYRRQRD